MGLQSNNTSGVTFNALFAGATKYKVSNVEKFQMGDQADESIGTVVFKALTCQ